MKTDVNQIFFKVLSKLPLDKPKLKLVAAEADVTYQTLHNWLWGETLKPRSDTLAKVATAMGYTFTLTKPRKLKQVA